jgi:hypothetical protein
MWAIAVRALLLIVGAYLGICWYMLDMPANFGDGQDRLRRRSRHSVETSACPEQLTSAVPPRRIIGMNQPYAFRCEIICDEPTGELRAAEFQIHQGRGEPREFDNGTAWAEYGPHGLIRVRVLEPVPVTVLREIAGNDWLAFEFLCASVPAGFLKR